LNYKGEELFRAETVEILLSIREAARPDASIRKIHFVEVVRPGPDGTHVLLFEPLNTSFHDCSVIASCNAIVNDVLGLYKLLLMRLSVPFDFDRLRANPS
jgi:hypothetical protein